MNIPGIRVNQWLPEWDAVPVDAARFQSSPPKHFYVTSIRASHLRALADVHQRDASSGGPRADDTSVQRTLEEDRTAEISRYIKVGFPLSSLGKRNLPDEERKALRKPGWLPTAIIANVINPGETRRGEMLSEVDTIRVVDDSAGAALIEYPPSWADNKWQPTGTHPLEIIDGQHRLSAFTEADDDFELPIVLFTGLDFSWQAYLFWTVNIKPKRINASLAFDLYPLLREQDWLEAGESLTVYRETRAQELVEALWSDSRSAWYDRINMLGQTGMKDKRPVTQAAFVRSLTNSFVRTFKGNKGLGGLFGGAADNSGLNWPRGQQSAFLIWAWSSLAIAILKNHEAEWSVALRGDSASPPVLLESDNSRFDPAFSGTESLLAADMGVRGFHMVLNDLCYLGKEDLGLTFWRVSEQIDVSSDEQADRALEDLSHNLIGNFLERLAVELSNFDWRNSKAKSLSGQEKESKQALRGSGGYNVLRGRILEFLQNSQDEQIAALARRAREIHNG